jgi:hypothetical protein
MGDISAAYRGECETGKYLAPVPVLFNTSSKKLLFSIPSIELIAKQLFAIGHYLKL